MKKLNYNQQTYGSVFKLIKYLGYLTKEPISVEIEGVVQKYDPSDRVMISDKFFRNFECVSCGRCCQGKFSLAYTSSDLWRCDPSNEEVRSSINRVLSTHVGEKVLLLSLGATVAKEISNCFSSYDLLYSNLKSIPIQISRKVYTNKQCEKIEILTLFDKMFLYSNEGKRCKFLFEKDGKWLCGVHELNPTHCKLPHIQIDKTKHSTRLIKRQYGRNWALGCKAKCTAFNYKVFCEWDLACLRRLEANMKDLQLKTWLPEIVEYLERNKEKFKKGDLPKSSVIIYDKQRNIPSGYIV